MNILITRPPHQQCMFVNIITNIVFIKIYYHGNCKTNQMDLNFFYLDLSRTVSTLECSKQFEIVDIREQNPKVSRAVII